MTLYQLLEVIDPLDDVSIFSTTPYPSIKAKGKNEDVFMELVKARSPLLNLQVFWIGHGEKWIAIRIPNLEGEQQ